MSEKKIKRLSRAGKSRKIIKRLGVARLCIYKSNNHIYAQIISPCGTKVLAQASTVESALNGTGKKNLSISLAEKVGDKIAQRAKDIKVDSVAFDRSGFRYHGMVKALAESARAGGLDF